MGSACEATGESCGTGGRSVSQSGCPCGTPDCSGEPSDCATGMWSGAFFQAMKQEQVELLKAKIHKAWGAKMDKAADAVLEAMGVHWQSMMAQAKAKADLKDRLSHLWREGQK